MRELITSFWNYDRTQPLVDRRVTIDGYILTIELNRPEVTFARAFSDAAFDVCEISFSNSVTTASLDQLPYVLIPVFLSRAFRHSSLFIRTDRGIRTPSDLRGKTIGLQEYEMTAAVVVRGFLRDHYGLDPNEIRWKVGGLERSKPVEFPSGKPPDGVLIESLSTDRSLEDGLLSGEVDAIVSLRPLTTTRVTGAKIAPLFPDAIAAERAWYQASGNFPIMHAVGVRKSLLNNDPDLGLKLYEAFLRAKQLAVAELEITQAQKITLPWPHAALAEAREIFGKDHWPYGMTANHHVLENQLRWSRLDGLQRRHVTLDELFDQGCRDT